VLLFVVEYYFIYLYFFEFFSTFKKKSNCFLSVLLSFFFVEDVGSGLKAERIS